MADCCCTVGHLLAPSGSVMPERIPSGTSRRASIVGHSPFYRRVVGHCVADRMFPTVNAQQLVCKHAKKTLVGHELPRVPRSGTCYLIVF